MYGTRFVGFSRGSVINGVIQAGYKWLDTADNFAIYDPNTTVLNPYTGGAYSAQMNDLTLTLSRGVSTNHECLDRYRSRLL